MNIKELYQEIILEHGKNPRNLGKTENFNKDAMGKNPLCGDNVHIFLKLDENKKVEDISFEGSGCAISMASASIMTDLIKGKEEVEVKEIVNDFLGMIKENPELFQRKYRHTRVRYIKGFPYGIHYILNEKIIEILAVLHTKLRRFLMEDYMNLKNLKQKKKLEILKCVPLVEKLLNHPN